MDYAALRVVVQNYCENSFSDTDFATMTKLAEQTINNTTQLPTLRKSNTSVMTIGNQYLNTPDDFLATRSFAVIDAAGTYTYLLNKDVSFIRESYPKVSTTGLPKHYAIFGPRTGTVTELTFILGPTPDAAYSAEVQYLAYPESIVTANNTWLSDNFDTVLFNGVMVEAV